MAVARPRPTRQLRHSRVDAVHEPVGEGAARGIGVLESESELLGTFRHSFPREPGAEALTVAGEARIDRLPVCDGALVGEPEARNHRASSELGAASSSPAAAGESEQDGAGRRHYPRAGGH